jgi:hypothetical protein
MAVSNADLLPRASRFQGRIFRKQPVPCCTVLLLVSGLSTVFSIHESHHVMYYMIFHAGCIMAQEPAFNFTSTPLKMYGNQLNCPSSSLEQVDRLCTCRPILAVSTTMTNKVFPYFLSVTNAGILVLPSNRQ